MRDPKVDAMNPGPTRRNLLAGGLGLVVSTASRQAWAHPIDNPPVFETARHQYTILEPQRAMNKVILSSLSGAPKLVAPKLGKVTLVSFWATWCVNCKTDLPALAELQRAMGKRIQVEAVSTDKTGRDDVQRFVSDLGVQGLSISLDPGGLLGELEGAGDGQFPTYGMPITYLVTPGGLIAGYIVETADWLSDAGRALISYYE
jgi:thiol-disulfide isomerase/thioredoxin